MLSTRPKPWQMPAMAAKKTPRGGSLVCSLPSLGLDKIDMAMPDSVTTMPTMARGCICSPSNRRPVSAAVGAERVMKSWPKREPIYM